MPHRVVYAPDADKDLDAIFYHILMASGHRTALSCIERIERFCESLAVFPQRGHRRDDVALGLRVIGFERRVTIAFHIETDRVVVDHILYGGRSLEGAFSGD